MPQIQKSTRNADIFAQCLQGVAFTVIAAKHDVSGSRIEQIFKAEAQRLHPDVAASIVRGHGFRDRFLAAMKAQEAAS